MKYFGTDGIRGKAYESLPLLRAYQLGVAIKAVFPNDDVVIGYDTRASSLDFVHALLNGLDGHSSVVGGMVPTPVIAFYSQVKRVIGVMITASHNPYHDNGLKVFEYGFKVTDKTKHDLERVMQTITTYEKKDVSYNESDISSLYLEFVSSLKYDETFKDIVFDCAHGATSNLSPRIFHVPHVFNAPNGININDNCGATHMEAAKRISGHHRVAISYDGDGDRMLMVIDGDVIYGDQILYLFAKDMKLMHQKVSVALSIMTNPGVIKAFQREDIDVFETPVGDTYLFEAIKEGHATMGAEASGHYMLTYDNGIRKVSIGDGMLAAKKVIDIISRYGLNVIKSWLDDITLVPMTTKSMFMNRDVLNKVSVKACIDSLKKQITPPHKLIVRASGTEEKIRLTVSLNTQKEVDEMIIKVSECLERG